jgi:hypothetical protein
MRLIDHLHERTKSHFNLSIGTGVALAALLDARDTIYIDREGKEPDIERYKGNIQNMVFNIRTLVRNIVQALPTQAKDIALLSSGVEVYDILRVEIELILSLFEGTDTKVYFFLPDYEQFYRKAYVISRGVKLTKTELLEGLIDTIDKQLNKATDLDFSLIGKTHKISLPGNTLLLSHYSQDLLNYKYTPKLMLLESHTGRILQRRDFNKRYKHPKDIDVSRLPYLEILLIILGGSHNAPFKRGIIKEVMRIADENNWTPMNTAVRIEVDLKKSDILTDLVYGYSALYK